MNRVGLGIFLLHQRALLRNWFRVLTKIDKFGLRIKNVFFVPGYPVLIRSLQILPHAFEKNVVFVPKSEFRWKTELQIANLQRIHNGQ